MLEEFGICYILALSKQDTEAIAGATCQLLAWDEFRIEN
jgi:hypothetical protein